MNKFKISTLLLFIVSVIRLTAQIPDGGIRLNAETGTIFQQIGKCTATAVEVTDQTFTEGINIAVESGISNTWNAQVKFPAIAGIETGDVLFVAFYARTIYRQSVSLFIYSILQEAKHHSGSLRNNIGDRAAIDYIM